MKKMTPREEEIYFDLIRMLQKIDRMEKQDKVDLVSELFLEHISAAIEDLTGLAGMTQQIFSDDSEEKELEGNQNLD